MAEKVFQILYCSRNNMEGTAAERQQQIEAILRASRVNNARINVTGALFYNTIFFAQVLEGEFKEVQGVFERLQLDSRHSDLVVLHSGYVAGRDFEEWSMAYAGASADFHLPLFEGETRASENGARVLSFLRDVVTKQETWALPERRPVRQSADAAALMA